MKTTTTSAFITIALAASFAPAHAQEINLSSLDEEPNRVHFSAGAEYGFVIGVGYSRILPILDRHVVLTGAATQPFASFDAADYRVRAGALMPILGSTHWKLAGALAPTLRGTHNEVGDMMNAGFDASLVGGLYMRHWFVALEGGVDFALTTHVSHSDAYRMDVYADAVDGWYANTGANLRGGLQAGVTFARYDVILRAGQVRDSNGAPPMLPYYGTLTVDARW